jgi:hypothetical protein
MLFSNGHRVGLPPVSRQPDNAVATASPARLRFLSARQNGSFGKPPSVTSTGPILHSPLKNWISYFDQMAVRF